jgi:putative nucleotidyltransferase with HDIG domain
LLRNRAFWAVALLLAGSFFLLTRESFFISTLNEGEIASRDYLAGQEVMVLDEGATRDQQEQARRQVLPVYDHDPVLRAQLDDKIVRFFALGREFVARQGEASETAKPAAEGAAGVQSTFDLAAAELGSATSIKFNDEQLRWLWQRQFPQDVEDRVRVLTNQLLRTGVVEDKETLLENRLNGIVVRDLQTLDEHRRVDLYSFRGRPEGVREYISSDVQRWPGLKRTERTLLTAFIEANVDPNYYLNRSETAARKESSAEAAGQVFRQIRAGQVIVRKGDMVDSSTAAVLAELGGNKPKLQRWMPIAGNLLLLTAFLALVSLALNKDWAQRHPDASVFGGVMFLVILGLGSIDLGMVVAHALAESFEGIPFNSLRSYSYAIPVAALPLIVSLFYGRSLALITGVGFSVLVGRQVGGDDMWAAIFALAGAMAAVYSLDRLKERSAVTRTGLVVGVVNAGSVVMLAAFRGMTEQPVMTIAFDVLCAFIGGILVAAVASFAVPILESVLSITTDIKLIELSDTNLPMLRRLAFEAPGTFQHSLMVANLAKVGCEAIDANSVLAYTAGLYHDIGKVLRPQYFVENQVGQNRHDKLAPSMSALIVINHVKDGVELGQEHRLPLPIIDAIRQHHGTRKLAFFFNRAKEQLDEDDPELRDDDYRYPGPKPQNKVMGVLMLADGVEAASRALREPSPSRIKTLVREILADCMVDGQLDQTDLTLEDLTRVTDEFCRVLESIYHRRIEYPGFAFNKERQPLRVVEGAKT